MVILKNKNTDHKLNVEDYGYPFFREYWDSNWRSSLKFVNWKDYKELTKDLKMIYQTPTEEQALQALAHFEEIWDDKYPYWSILAQTLAKSQHLLCLS